MKNKDFLDLLIALSMASRLCITSLISVIHFIFLKFMTLLLIVFSKDNLSCSSTIDHTAQCLKFTFYDNLFKKRTSRLTSPTESSSNGNNSKKKNGVCDRSRPHDTRASAQHQGKSDLSRAEKGRDGQSARMTEPMETE